MTAFVVVLARHRGAVRRRAEGVHPRAGHRSDRGHDRGGAGHGVRQAGRVPGQQSLTIISQRSERRRARLHDRRTGRQHARRPQPGANRRPPEAARRSIRAGQRHHRHAAPAARRRAGHAGLHAEPADRAHRRPGEQEPVSVLDAVAGSRRALRRVADVDEDARANVQGLEDLTSDLGDRTVRRSTCRSIATRRRRWA